LLFSLLACSGDKGTGDDPEMTFEITGDRSVQVWSSSKIRITATTKSGSVPTLTAPDLPSNATFVDSGNGAGALTFSPSIEQVGNQNIEIMASTATARDSTTILLTVINEAAAHAPLIPLALGNRWIYQSVHNRLDNDTVLINAWSANDGRPIFAGTFYPTLWTLLDGIIQQNDTVYSKTLGPQFVIPDHLPAEIYVNSRSTCFWAMVTRQIEWSTEPITVPAGTFSGCFVFSCTQENVCESIKQEIFVEEITIKPGVGIIKIAQIKSSDCAGNCSSRWELLSSDLE
ncbi:MAG: hypothetical protein WBP29_00330, partial [Candidatus Zixiibacteriota bacterium]